MGGTAWVTLATNDSYALGALVVANSLKKVNTVHDLAILITPGVTLAMKNELLKVFNFVKEVDVFDSKDESNLRLLARPDLGITFTKIHAWRLTQYTKCVFLDADVLIVQNCDELFDREELSAAPDAGWPDCFNSGVFVFRPSDTTYSALVDFALVNGSFDGGDQGLLNLFFSDWATADITKHLPFVYNMCSTSTYSYLPALKQFGSRVKIIHFIGSSKPWLQQFDASTGSVQSSSSHLSNFLQLWWDIFCVHVHPTLSTEMSGLARALAQVPVGTPISAEQLAYEDHMHRQHWEEGHIDYLGKDSWDNIWKKISQTIEPEKSSKETPAAPITEADPPKVPTPVEAAPPKTASPIEAAPPKAVVPVEAAPPKASAPVEPAQVKAAEQAPSSTPVQITPTQDAPSLVQSTPEAVQTGETLVQPVPIKTDEPKPETKADVTQLIPSQTPAVATTVGTPKLSTSVASFDEEPIVSAPVIDQTPLSTPVSAQPVPPVPSEQKEQTGAAAQSPSTKAPETQAIPASTDTPATPASISVVPLEPKLEKKPEPVAAPAQTEPTKPASTPAVAPAAESVSLPPSERSSTVSTPQVKPELLSLGPVKTEEPASVSKTSSQPSSVPSVPQVTPSTPTVTSPTPPESPLSAVSVQLEKLDIDPSVPATPPAGADAPVPPKRKGGKGSGAQGQATPSQSEKGGKGKGKK